MKTTIQESFDFRQSPYWAEYMKQIGWQVETIEDIQIYIRTLPFLGSFIKIQHPLGKIPFKKIDSLALKYKTIFVTIEPHVNGYKENQFKNNDYMITKMHHAPTATRKIQIDNSLDSIVATFSENAKRNLRKATGNKLLLKTIMGKDDKQNIYFEQFFQLQKNLTNMKKFYAPGYEESYKKYKALKKGSLFIFTYDGSTTFTTSKNEPIAAVWYGIHKGVVTYLQTGITEKGYATLANYLLVLEGIKVGKKLGCSVFDFESIYDPRYPNESKRWKGYSEFKSRFHGEEIYYPPSWIKIYHPLFRSVYEMSAPFLP